MDLETLFTDFLQGMRELTKEELERLRRANLVVWMPPTPTTEAGQWTLTYAGDRLADRLCGN